MKGTAYNIEKRSNYYGDIEYRFVSIYNSCKGTWTFKREEAINDGERHQNILCNINGSGLGLNREQALKGESDE